MVRKLLNRRDNEIAAVGSVNASLLRVSVSLRPRFALSNRSDISPNYKYISIEFSNRYVTFLRRK